MAHRVAGKPHVTKPRIALHEKREKKEKGSIAGLSKKNKKKGKPSTSTKRKTRDQMSIPTTTRNKKEGSISNRGANRENFSKG